jgi:hypothetical protein
VYAEKILLISLGQSISRKAPEDRGFRGSKFRDTRGTVWARRNVPV